MLDFREPRRPAFTSRQRFVLRDTRDSPELLETTEQLFSDPVDGDETIVERTVYLLGCSHLAGYNNPAELAGQCAKCGTHLCYMCINIRCERCHKQLCPDCRRNLSHQIYCSACRVKEALKRSVLFTFAGLHKLMSKEWMQ